MTAEPWVSGSPASASSGAMASADPSAQARIRAQRLEMIVDGIDAGTWEWNPQTGEMWVNERWAQIVGYSLEELQPITAETFERLVHPDDLAQSDEALQAHFDGHVPAYECLVRMRHRHGHWVWVQDRGKVQQRDGEGRPLWMAGAHADISDLQQARQDVAAAQQRLQSIVDASDEVAVIVMDVFGVITLFNTGAERLLGYTASEVLGSMPPAHFHDPFEVDGFLQAQPTEERVGGLFGYMARRARDQSWSRQWTFVRKDGQRRQVSLSVSAVRDNDGQVNGFVGMAMDLTQVLQARAEARLAEEKFAGAFTSAALGMALVSVDGRWLDVNESLCRILGYSRAELLQTDFQRLTHPDDLHTDLLLVQDLLAGRRAHYHLEKRYFGSDGGVIWARLSVSLVRSEQGEPLHFVSQIQDITAQRASEQRLHETEQRSRITLDAVTDLVLSVTLDGRIEYANAAAQHALGEGGGTSLVGRRVDDVLQLTTEYAPHSRLDNTVLLDPDSNAVDLHADLLLMQGGEGVPVDVTQAWLREDDGRLRGAVWVLRNVTQQRARQREARQLAEIDPLTDLANRRGFEAHLRQAIVHTERTGQAATLMFLDLDRFKPVNDTWGHLAGDAVLWAVASALREAVRDSDVVARLGGDEFAVILAGCSLYRARRIGEELLHAVSTLAVPWEGQVIRIGCSIGIAAITAGMGVEDAVAAADTQCYRAKAAGRNTVRSEPSGMSALPDDQTDGP